MFRRCRIPLKLGFFNRAAVVQPHPDKVYKGGEDAYVACDELLAVADGVGGWKEKDIDPQAYARSLMKSMYEHVQDCKFDGYPIDLDAAITSAADEANVSHAGSSTMLVCSIVDDVVSVANLGDCSCLILRDVQTAGPNQVTPEVIYRSEEMQHDFNYPYQLGRTSKDSISDVKRAEIAVKPNDVIILGSDGVFDNVYDDTMIQIISDRLQDASLKSPMEVNRALWKVTHQIVEKAAENSRTKGAATPHVEAAMEQGILLEIGKPDDMTLLIALVESEGYVYGSRHASLIDIPPPLLTET